MMEQEELSAFEAYSTPQKTKKKKKTLAVDVTGSLVNNVPQHGDVPVVPEKSKNNVENKKRVDAVWENFVSDLQVKKKKKKITESTPLPPLVDFDFGVIDNIFLSNNKGLKKKKPKKTENLDFNFSDTKGQMNLCSLGHPLKGKVVCKKCKKLENLEPEVVTLDDVPVPKKAKKNVSVNGLENGIGLSQEASTGSSKNVLENGIQDSSTTIVKKKKLKRKIDDSNSVQASEDNKKEQDKPKLSPVHKKKQKKNTSGSKDLVPDNDIEVFDNQELPPINIEKAEQLKPKDDKRSSVEKGREMLEWILSPVGVDDFFENYWEKKPLHIARSCPEYFEGIFSLEDLDQALRLNSMYFGKNVDVTAYENGVRTTENPEGRARPAMVWEKYRQGRSIRVLNPQTFIPNVGIMVSTLQDFFHCMVGVNSYLTPAGTQGFAPHYDDIEAFVLQLEGEKLWKVYAPRSEEETLPRFSSPNYSQDEIGEPILEVRLQPGDLLYFPRGFIHQARSVETHHSLHITVSTYQCNTWGDLLSKALPAALDLARDEFVELREGIPLNLLSNLGAVYSDSESPERAKILKCLEELVSKVIDICPWDAAADQVGKQFIHDSFPPNVPDVPLHEKWENWFKKPLLSDVSVKLIAAHCIRLVLEGDALMVYYNTDNSKEYHGEEAQCFEISVEGGPIVETLLMNYPKYTKLKNLPQGEPIGGTALKKLMKQFYSHSLLLVKNAKTSK